MDPTFADPEPSIAELIAARPHLAMHAMDGLLIDEVPLNRIADAVGTPTWVYSASAMRRRYRMLGTAIAGAGLDAHVHYAVKANDRLAVLRLFAREGAGADVVSEGELLRAREAGIPAGRIVFSGVGKSQRELRLALAEDIAQINVESAEELSMLSALAASLGRTARVALRVNPDVDAGTHGKIATGRAQDKFGIPYADAAALYARSASLPGIEPAGLAVHIGSQITALEPFRAAFARLGRPGADAARGGASGWRRWIAAAASASPTATIRRRARSRSPARSAPRSTTWMCGLCWSPAAGWSGRRACCSPAGAREAAGRVALRRARRGDERPGAPGDV